MNYDVHVVVSFDVVQPNVSRQVGLVIEVIRRTRKMRRRRNIGDGIPGKFWS